jgi:hypothetical protein
MFPSLRQLFIRHTWIEVDPAHRTCTICGQAETRDVDVEVIGTNPWYRVARGDLALHRPPFTRRSNVSADTNFAAPDPDDIKVALE